MSVSSDVHGVSVHVTGLLNQKTNVKNCLYFLFVQWPVEEGNNFRNELIDVEWQSCNLYMLRS